MVWTWTFEDADGDAVAPASVTAAPVAPAVAVAPGESAPGDTAPGDTAPVGPVSPEFPSQGDAESWVGEYWRDLLDVGVEQVTLFEDTRRVYGPMGLRPADDC